MALYIYQQQESPNFRWDASALSDQLAGVHKRQGLLLGRMKGMGFKLRADAILDTLTEEVQKSSEIEGELLNRSKVRSSVARGLGLEAGALSTPDRTIDGVVDMTLDATQNHDAPLTKERLLGWHAALFPDGRSGFHAITTGAWRDDRDGPMQVVSGPIGRERVHFQAPDATLIDTEMGRFLAWFEGPDTLNPLLKAALAHFWFVTVHPFDDGNGRIGRAISEMALARSEESNQRFYSMSSQILKERHAYYEILESTSKRDMDITPWMNWFLGCLDRAITGAETILAAVFARARLWDSLTGVPINERQRTMLNRLIEGFEGKLTTAKWAKIAKCSHDTALRDIQDLIGKGMLAAEAAGGRSTSYVLVKS